MVRKLGFRAVTISYADIMEHTVAEAANEVVTNTNVIDKIWRD